MHAHRYSAVYDLFYISLAAQKLREQQKSEHDCILITYLSKMFTLQKITQNFFPK